MRVLLALFGFVLIAVSLFGDYIAGGAPGFGSLQLLTMIGGVSVVCAAALLWNRIHAFRPVSVSSSRDGFIEVKLRKRVFFSLTLLVIIVLALEVVSWITLSYDAKRASTQNEEFNFYRERFGPPVYSDPNVARDVYLDTKERLVYSYVPYYEWRTEPGQSLATIQINSEGFRGPQVRQRGISDRRVILCGGSVAWAFGARSEERTLRFCLEEELNRRFPQYDWEVICLADQSYVLRQERIRLELEGLELRPDFVVFVDGVNDVASLLWGQRLGDHMRTTDFRNRLAYQRAVRVAEDPTLSSQVVGSIKRLLLKSNTIRLLNEVRHRLSDQMEQHPSPSADFEVSDPSSTSSQDLELFFDSEIARIEQMTLAHPMKIAMVLQPVIYTRPLLTPNDEKIISWYEQSNAFGPKSQRRFQELYTALREFYSETPPNSAHIRLDHSSIFDGEEVVFFDVCHLKDDLYAMWAARLVEDLQASGWFSALD